MPSPRSRIGRSAEIVAAADLGSRGYRIIASNYRCKSGEIDLIAEESGYLVFVEVRCRRSDAYGSPAESVTSSKQGKLIASAQHFLNERGISDRNCRFDVVAVVAADGRLVVDEVIQDAFGL